MKECKVKSSLLLFLLLQLVNIDARYDTIKNGAYRNIVEFKRNKPVYSVDFRFNKVEYSAIPELYEISTRKASVQNKLSKEIWAIYQKPVLYINAWRVGMHSGYIAIPNPGKYSYFRGIPVKTIQQQSELNYLYQWLDVTGAIMKNIEISQENKDNIHYVLNLESGLVTLLNKDTMERILYPYPDLLVEYKKEGPKSLDTMLKYLDLINQKTTEQPINTISNR